MVKTRIEVTDTPETIAKAHREWRERMAIVFGSVGTRAAVAKMSAVRDCYSVLTVKK